MLLYYYQITDEKQLEISQICVFISNHSDFSMKLTKEWEKSHDMHGHMTTERTGIFIYLHQNNNIARAFATRL